MKRTFLCVICLLLLIGCGKASKPVAEHFVGEFTATYKEMQLAGEIKRDAVGTLTMTLSAPVSLAGLRCCLEGEEVTLTLGELEYKTAVIPAAAVPQVLRDVLDDLSRGATKNADGTFSGTAGTYGFTASVAADSGFLETVSVPNVSLEITFKNMMEQEV